MSKSETGGPAFPIPGLQDDESFNGMSLRDYFAAKALQGLYACADWRSIGFNTSGKGSQPEFMARHAYEVADAMLAERSKS